MNREKRREAAEIVERITELPMLVLSLLVVALLVIPLVISLSESTGGALELIQWIIWAAFAAELGLKTYLSEERLPYLRTHWFDVAIVILPFLRPLRVARSARALRGIRGLRVVAFGSRATHSLRSVLHKHGLRYVLLIAVFLLVACAILVAHFERGADGNIKSFGDALWWAITTITTVGYGDRFPVTDEGRGLAALLMIAGISLFSFLTASIATFMLQPSPGREEPTLSDLLSEIRALHQRLDAMQLPVSASEADAAT